MQSQIPEKSNLLRSHRFITHQPTFESIPSAQGFTGLEPKQESGKIQRIVRPSRLASSQLATSNDVTENSISNPPGTIGRFAERCFSWMVSPIVLARNISRQPLSFLCICMTIVVVLISHPPTSHVFTQLSTFVSQALHHTTALRFPAFPTFTCPLGLCKVEESASAVSNEPRDLTVWSGGARVVEKFTSPTFGHKNRSRWNWWGKNSATVHWAGPVAVLDPQISCWSFEGTSGFITLQLIANSSITLVQVAHAVESQPQKFAPQSFIVWALVDLGSFSVKEIPRHGTPPPNLERLVSHRLYPIQLGTFYFDVASHAAGQSFVVDTGVLEGYGSRVDKVMFHILSNWGAERTCLYHLRVFGIL